MKNLIKMLCLVTITNIAFSQQIVNKNSYNQGNYIVNNNNKYFKDLYNTFDPFIGTWKYVNGNQTFKVVIWKSSRVRRLPFINCYIDEIQGDFSMIQDEGLPTQTIVYQSHKYFGGGTQYWPPAILISGVLNDTKTGGSIMDNCVAPYDDISNVYGGVSIDIFPTTPLTAHWLIYKYQDITFSGQPQTFRVPLDIILTKQ